jgi:hypothetical protein
MEGERKEGRKEGSEIKYSNNREPPNGQRECV